MNAADTASIVNFHNKVIAEFGSGSIAAVGWVSPESQGARYKAMAKLADFTGMSVLDAGCGHADLLPFLSGLYTDIRYTGLEQMPALLNIAIERYSHLPHTHFVKADFSEAELPAADYVIASGSLSYRNSDPHYLFKMIKKLFLHCRIGFGFNLLSALTYPDDAIVSYEPTEIQAFCSSLTSNTRLAEGYWPNDFTVMMYH